MDSFIIWLAEKIDNTINGEKYHKELLAILNKNNSLPTTHIKINDITYNLIFNKNEYVDNECKNISCYYDIENIKLSNQQKNLIISSINDDIKFLRCIINKICLHFKILNTPIIEIRPMEGREYNFIIVEEVKMRTGKSFVDAIDQIITIENTIIVNQLNCFLDMQFTN